MTTTSVLLRSSNPLSMNIIDPSTKFSSSAATRVLNHLSHQTSKNLPHSHPSLNPLYHSNTADFFTVASSYNAVSIFKASLKVFPNLTQNLILTHCWIFTSDRENGHMQQTLQIHNRWPHFIFTNESYCWSILLYRLSHTVVRVPLMVCRAS